MPNRSFSPPIYLVGLGLGAIALASFAYWPGLSGVFLFDDFTNINALGATGPVDNWNTFWRYVTSGTADPTGRPLALLSFLIDGNNWPTDPYPFKRTNLILHLINGLLLGSVLWRLGRAITPAEHQRKQVALAAGLGAAFWLLHPLMVSTTLYIVQRQAMLPATFVLLALHGWLTGRVLLQHGANIRGASWMMFSIGGGTLLAVLSKGNGVLLPALLGIVEVIILRPSAPPKSSQRTLNTMCLVLLLVPSLAVLAYLSWRATQAFEYTPQLRPWTLGERLLTQPRIVLDYMTLLWVPRPFTAGLYNDNIVVSTGLFAPWTTLPALLFVLAMPVFGYLLRKNHPVIATALLFFWVGHLMESSVIPLEMYYEHRNYLPAMFLFWPLTWWLTQPGSQAKGRLAASVVIIFALTGMTHARSSLWGNEREQAMVWAALNPDSARAQTTAALHEMHMGRPDLAYKRLASLEVTMNDETQVAFNRIGASCRMGGLLPGDLQTAMHAIESAQHGRNLTFKWMSRMLNVAANDGCSGFSLNAMEQLIHAAKDNPKLHSGRGRHQEFLNLEARVALIKHKPELALEKFNAALEAQFRPDAALEQAATFGRSGYPAFGLKHLEHYETLKNTRRKPRAGMQQIHAWVMRKQGYWEYEVAHLREALNDDVEHSQTPQLNDQ